MMISNVFGQGFDSPHLHFYLKAVRIYRKMRQQKTLSVEIRLHRDCDSRWVTDSVPEVKSHMSSRTYVYSGSLYGAHKAD